MLDFNCETTVYPNLPTLTTTVSEIQNRWQQVVEMPPKGNITPAILVDSGGAFAYDSIMEIRNTSQPSQGEINEINATLEGIIEKMDAAEVRHQAREDNYDQVHAELNASLDKLEAWLDS